MQAERKALRGSLWASVMLAGLAIILGLAANSRVLIFDGAYIFIGLLLTWLSLRVSALSASGPSAKYPFGRDSLTPLVVVVQGIALAGTLIFAIADAVLVIMEGSTPVSPLVLGLYGGLSALASVGVSRWIRRTAPEADLALAESSQWNAGALLSVVVMIGAATAALLLFLGFTDAAMLVDPVLVLVACAVASVIPFKLIRNGLTELLEGAAPAEIVASVSAVVEKTRQDFDLSEPTIRTGKVGRKLYVEVDFVVTASCWGIEEEDAVRRSIVASLESLPLEIWAVVSLTADPSLA